MLGGLAVQCGDAVHVVSNDTLGGVHGEDARVAQVTRAAAVAFEGLGIFDGDEGRGDGGQAQGGGDQGDAGFGQLGCLVRRLREARHEVLLAEHDGGDPFRGAGEVSQVEVGLGQLDQQVDGEVPLGQSELLFALGQEVVEGFHFIGRADHGEDESGEGGGADGIDVQQHAADVVHAVAAHDNVDPVGKGLGQHGRNGLPAMGLVGFRYTVLEIEDDRPGPGGQLGRVVAQLVEVEIPHIQGRRGITDLVGGGATVGGGGNRLGHGGCVLEPVKDRPISPAAG